MAKLNDQDLNKKSEIKGTEKNRDLSNANAFLDSVIENIPNMIFVKDAETLKFVRFNKAGEDLLGISRDDLIGKSDFDLFSESQAKAFTDADRGVLSQKSVVDIPEEPITSMTLGPRTLHTKKIPVYDENGKPRYLLGISEDITELKKLEGERFQGIEDRIAKVETDKVTERFKFLSRASALLGSSLDFEKTLSNLTHLAVPHFADWCSIQLLDPNGNLNQLAYAHSDPEKMKWARKFQEDYPPDPREQTGAGEVARTGKSMLINNITDEMIAGAARDAGHLKVLKELDLGAFLCAPIKIYDRVIGSISLISTRVSGRAYSQQDLLLAEELGERAGFAVENARLYKESRTLNKVKDEFLATLSHELRTPLNVIQGHAEILKVEGPTLSPKEFVSSVDAILRNARAQLTIVSDLLDVSSIITGKISYKPTSLAPSDVIRTTVEGLAPVAATKKIGLSYNTKEAPENVWSDPTRLQQIIFNLISNALKFTPEGGKVIVTAGHKIDHWWITVEDTGPGIDKDFLPFVFERFRQEDSSASRRHGGLGLGLSIVRNLTELHGGTVHVTSEGPGKGACFKICLPMSGRATDKTPPIVETIKAVATVAKVNLEGLCVLLVEDSADNRFLIERLLAKHGAKTISADSAKRAREILKDTTPDIIISDIGMPEENGLEFMRRLRGKTAPEKIPAIALTAYVREEEKEAAIEAGFQAHVGKPVTASELVAAIASVLNRH